VSLTGIPSKDELSALIKQASTEAQASGLAIEDHLAPLLRDLLHGALTEAATDVSVALKPALEALAPAVVALNAIAAALAVAMRESAAWRAIIERFNLSPEPPK
jgi:hypothetical protein